MNNLPKSTRKIYWGLRSEVIGIHFRLTVLRQLFTDQAIVDLLNRAAYRFFNTLRNDLLDTIVLMVDRLLDPAKTFNKHSNASLRQLIDVIDPASNQELISTLKSIIDEIITKSSRLVYWRDKWVGHRDYAIILGAAPMPALSLVELDDVLSLIGKFINAFEAVFQDVPAEINLYDNRLAAEELDEIDQLKVYQPQPYEHMIFLPDDANTIITLIKEASSS